MCAMDQYKQATKPHPQPAEQQDELPIKEQREGEKPPEDDVEESSEDSFPASDPPSFTGSKASQDIPRDHEGH